MSTRDLAAGHLKFVLSGHRMQGGFALIRLKPRPGEGKRKRHWLLVKERDSHAMRRTNPPPDDPPPAPRRARARGAKPQREAAFLPIQLSLAAAPRPPGRHGGTS